MRAHFASTPCWVADLSRTLQPVDRTTVVGEEPEPKPEELLLLELRTVVLLHCSFMGTAKVSLPHSNLSTRLSMGEIVLTTP